MQKRRISNDEVFSSEISLQHSTFLVRYSIFLQDVWQNIKGMMLESIALAAPDAMVGE
jgi:hypothetical protein